MEYMVISPSKNMSSDWLYKSIAAGRGGGPSCSLVLARGSFPPCQANTLSLMQRPNAAQRLHHSRCLRRALVLRSRAYLSHTYIYAIWGCQCLVVGRREKGSSGTVPAAGLGPVPAGRAPGPRGGPPAGPAARAGPSNGPFVYRLLRHGPGSRSASSRSRRHSEGAPVPGATGGGA